MTMHECTERFTTQKIDDCSGEGFNRCFGIGPMTLEVYYMDKDGREFFYDNWIELEVNYCPYCGLKSNKNA